jgi:hypothetical protein
LYSGGVNIQGSSSEEQLATVTDDFATNIIQVCFEHPNLVFGGSLLLLGLDDFTYE